MAEQSLVRSKLTPAEVQALRMVLDGLPSAHSRRAYERALTDFFCWHKGVGRPLLNKAVVQRYAAELRVAGMAASSINSGCPPFVNWRRKLPTTARLSRSSPAASAPTKVCAKKADALVTG